ncbi:unnamed protein product [Paramecium primaurelia]|uniref:Transmembrane protein n=1 Tax=Paramecium primaurelia TaxID=5886 RepID=A0A8S1M5E5_PARPR|nr:unnamed protein product [Paramecium primaurelia]
MQLIMLMQPLFMIIENGIEEWNPDYSFLHLITLLIFRQDVLLLDYDIAYTRVYLVVLIIFTIQKAWQFTITYLLYRIKERERQFQKMEECTPLRISLIILAVYTQFSITILHLIFSTLCIISFAFCIKDGQEYVHLILSLLTYILWQADYLITYTIFSTSLTFKHNFLDISQITLFTYFAYLFQQLQIVIFCILQNQNSVRLSNIILMLFDILSQIVNQFLFQTYIFKESRQILYFTCSIKFVLCFYYLGKSIDQKQMFEYLIIPLLLLPIIYYGLISIDIKIHYESFVNLFKEEPNLNKLVYQLKLILNQCDIDKQMIPLKSSLINKSHRQQCHNQLCICSNKIFISEISQANAITQTILKQFIYNKISFILHSKEAQKSHQYNQLVIVQTLLLYDFGWLTDSIKNLTQLLNCQFNNQNFVIRKEIQKKIVYDESCNETSTRKDKSDEHQTQFIRLKVQISLIDQCRINYILYLAKFKLKSQLGTSMHAYQQLMVTDFIQSFLTYDQSLKQIQTQMMEAINDKIEFYYKIIKDEKQNLNVLGKCTKEICFKLNKVKKQLKQIYAAYPCSSIQRCICFFQCELLNNYYEANKTSTLTSMQDDKMFKNKKITNYDIQVDQTAYAILSIKGELDDFHIEQVSSYFLKLIGKTSNKDIHFFQLLPRFMKNWHPSFIHNFFNDGQSRYYKSFNQSFISTNTGLLKTVYLCYDITKILSNQNLVFAAFLQELPDQKCFLLSYGTNQRLTFSENFFKKIGFHQKIILGLPQVLTIVNGLYLQYLIPSFPQGDIENDTFQLNTEMRFLDDKHLKDIQNEGVDLGMYILDPKQWQKEDQVQFYSVSIIVTKRHVSQQSYLLIEFSTITKIAKNLTENSKFQTIQNNDITSLQSQEAEFINDSFASLMNLSDEAEPKKVNIFDVRMKEFLQNEIQDEEAANIVSYRKDEFQNNVFPQSHRLLLSERKKEIQQEFYNIEQMRMDSLKQSSIYESHKQRPIEHNVIDEIQSQQSSVGGVKESQLFKKFEMIEKIIKKKKFDKMSVYLILLLLQTAFFISFALIVITLISTELLMFIQEIDMISLHASIMAPHDLYLSIKVTISAYQQQYREKYIDNATLYKLIDPLYQFNAPYYFDLQNNLFDVLQNEHLSAFFTDQQVTVYFMGNNDSVTYSKEMSFREELLAILHAQYQFKRVFDARKNANGQACQVLQFANYFNLQDKLEELTDEILEYSKNRSLAAADQWFIIWLIYQLIAICIGLITLFYKRSILKTYEKLLSLFYFSDKNSLEQEIQKLKHLNTLIQQNQDLLSKYDFNFREREELVNRKKKESQSIKQEKPKKQGEQKLQKIIPIIAFFCIYIYFLVYSVIIHEETKIYLTKYKQTTDFYRLVQDLRFRSGNIYVYREIFFRWSNFTYLNKSDLNRLYGLVEKSQNVMQIYVNGLSQQQNDEYLFSTNYINFISQVENSNLCNFIDSKYLNLTPYCEYALDGVLQKGMIPSLNYISQSIRSQQEINNFTKRAEVHFYELEGAQVICLAFQNVSEQLKQSMIELTQSFNQTNEVLSYLFLLSQLLFSIVFVTCFRRLLITEFTMYKKSLQLIPIQVLLGDDSLERALRQFEFTEKI